MLLVLVMGLLSLNFLSVSHAAEEGLPDGEHREFYNAARVKKFWNVKDGQIHGSYKTYYKSGKLKEELQYEQGELHGLQKKYFETGVVSGQWNMLKGKKQGAEQLYYPNGQVKEVNNYKNNRFDGKQIKYRKTGLVHKERTYKNGKLSGTQKDYWLNGQISVVSKYQNGRLHGEFKTYSPSGELLKISLYEDGQPVRTEKENERFERSNEVKKILDATKVVKKSFYDTGELQSVSQFENGVLHGLVKEYFENGGARSVQHYVEGLLDGIQIIYFDNGQIASKNIYSEGKYNGIQEFFYRNGVLRARENYVMGKMDGLQEYYYENGVLLARKVYTMGNLLRLQKFIYEDGVLKTIEELIENQLIVREIVDKEESKDDVEESILTDVFIQADIQEFYENGNLKLELEIKNAKRVLQRIYYEEGGLHYEIKWDGGEQLYYESYGIAGVMEKSEYADIHKRSDLVAHQEFCDLMDGEMLENGCDIPAKDSGTPCEDSDECQAFCVAYNAKRDDKVKGECSARSLTINGCYHLVEDGVATQQKGDCSAP